MIVSDCDDSAAAAIALLHELARQHELGGPRLREARTQSRVYENSCPLQKLPPGEWRSLGGYFDYSCWPDRDRFMELDRAIALAQPNRLYGEETDDGIF